MAKVKINKHIEKQKEFYKIGNVIYCGYWRSYDRVLDFKVVDNWNWFVTVAECTKDGIITGEERTHSTAFDKNDRVIS